jgi:ABC-type spermidine/putrescine transport system permease subunit II
MGAAEASEIGERGDVERLAEIEPNMRQHAADRGAPFGAAAAVAGILATALFCFVTAWNEFIFGYVLINDEARRTLTPGIMIFKGPHLTDWGALMAASVLGVVPVAIFFVYLQRFLVEGLAAGAVKG